MEILWKVLANSYVGYTQNFGKFSYSLKLSKLAGLIANSFSRVKAHTDATLVVFWMKFLLTDCIPNSPNLTL